MAGFKLIFRSYLRFRCRGCPANRAKSFIPPVSLQGLPGKQGKIVHTSDIITCQEAAGKAGSFIPPGFVAEVKVIGEVEPFIAPLAYATIDRKLRHVL